MIAAYIRVSSPQQSFASQKSAIEQAARGRSEKIERFFQEKKGGASSSAKARPVFAELLASVRRGELSKLYVFRVDRLGRGGIRDTLANVDVLRSCGCQLVSVADGFSLDGPAGDVVLAVMAWAAQMERQALGDRISAARRRIEAAGGRWGRPRRIDPGELAKIRALCDAGHSHRVIAARVKVPRSTIQRALAQKGHYAQPRVKGQKKAVARET
jgi:DNA invertase Pin-like site-specific DNA recombinase